MKPVWIALAAGLGLTACSATGNGMPDSGNALDRPGFEDEWPVADTCGAEARAYLIGQRASEVDMDSLARTVRVIGLGDPVTQDFRPDRLNLDLDADGVILRAWCG